MLTKGMPLIFHCHCQARFFIAMLLATVLASVGVANPTAHWKTPYSTGGTIFSSPTIATDGTVYIGSNDNKLHAINSDGSAKWTFTTGDWVDSTPAIGSDGTIYFGSWDNQLYAINPMDGSKLWDFNTSSSIIASPAIGVEGRIYFGSKDEFFYALESNGSLAWETYIGNAITSSAAIGQDGTIYFGDENGTFHALNQDGSTKWTYEVDDVADTNKSILSSPAIDLSGNLYFGSGNGYCYSIADGVSAAVLNWKVGTNDRVDASPVLGQNNEVFFVSRDGYLRAVDQVTGISNWEVFSGDVFYSSPVVDSNGKVYVIGYTGFGENHLFAFNSDGTKSWDTNNSSSPLSIGGLVDSSLALDSSGNLFFGCYDKKVYAVNVGAGLADNSWPQFQRNNKRSGAWPSFTISVTIEPNGAGEVSGAGIYNPGASATLNVTSNTGDGYNFEYWSNGQTGSSNPLVLEVTSDLTLTANFGLVAHNLVVNAGTGGTATGSGNIPHGTLKTITATPSTGYSFTGWSGTGITDSSSATTTVNMTLARTVTANFTLNSYLVNVILEPSIAGSVNGTGTYSHGDTVTLSVTSNTGNGYYFDYWSGSIGGSENPLTFQINSNVNLSANFGLNSYPLTVNATIGGTATGSGNISHGEDSIITATPSLGYLFSGWSGASVFDAASMTTTIQMTQAQSVTATFSPLQFSLSALAGEGGSINDVNGTYSYDSNVSLIAIANTGYAFSNWTQSGAGITDTTASTTSIRVDRNQSIQAHFSPLNYDLNITATTGGVVSSSPPGSSLPYNSLISLNATPDPGYYFSGWEGNGIEELNSSTTTLTISGNQSVKANFAEIPDGNFALQLNANPEFSASELTGTNIYSVNQTVTISATPSSGYTFVNWTGGTVADLNSTSTTLTITEDLNLTANFALTRPSISVSAGIGGDVNDLNSTYNYGSIIPIVATPNTGYTFEKWNGNGIFENQFSNSTNITLLNDANITASFTRSIYEVSVSVQGQGVAQGNGMYSHGDTISLNATPAMGYYFIKWSGTGMGNSYNTSLPLTINQDLNITATFEKISYSLDLTAGIGGTINDVNTSQLYGSTVSIVATPDIGYSFAGWEGNGTFTDRSLTETTITVNSDTLIKASFTPNTHSVTIVTSGEGNVTGEGNYSFGESITLTASAQSGNYFEKWSGSGIEDSNSTSLTITVTENLTFTASFITSPTNLIESLQVTIISPSWYANDWLGYFYQSDNGWCYHYNLGWIFPETQSDGSIWLWSPQLKWLWLNSDSFTKQQSWSATDENWIYFDFESLPSPRFFRYKDEIWSPFDKNQEVSILDSLF